MASIGQRASDADFAPRLREALRERGLTNHQLALQLGVSDNTVSSWLRGTFHPRYPRLVEIADALDMDIAAIVRGARVDSEAAGEAPSTRAVAADAIITRLADLELEAALDGFKQAAPDLLSVLHDAQQHVHKRNR